MASITVFQDTCMGGKSMTFTGPISNLKDYGFNDAISSIVVTSGAWALYQDSDYKGTLWKVSATSGVAGTSAYPSSTAWGGSNDSISSLQPIG
jgi:Beta/Gamma crystallin